MTQQPDPRRARLKALFQEKAVLRGDFTLSSGQKSSYYFDGRKVTHDPEGIALVGALVSEAMERHGLRSIGGPATAANPIITAAQLTAQVRGYPVTAFYVRGDRKDHGTGKLIEGNPPPPGASVMIVDDTMTSGGSILKAIQAVEEEGLRVALILVLVDRRQGGAEAIRAKGYAVHALLEADAQGNIL